MTRQSKNLGITDSCPKCKRTIVKNLNFEGMGTLELYIKCPHCERDGIDTYCKVVVKTKVSVRVELLPAIVALVFILLGFSLYFGIANNAVFVQKTYQYEGR